MEAERNERPGGKSGSRKERVDWKDGAKNRKLNCRRLQEKLKEHILTEGLRPVGKIRALKISASSERTELFLY